MHAFSEYNVKITGNEEEKNAIIEVLANALELDVEDFEEDDDGEIFVEENYDIVWIEDLEKLASNMAKAAPGSSFDMQGRVDCAENSGEIMEFKMSYKEHKLTILISKWFYEWCVDDDMSYEDFCEEFGFDESRCTEEEYEAAKNANDGTIYILDSGDGDLVSKIELNVWKTIDI